MLEKDTKENSYCAVLLKTGEDYAIFLDCETGNLGAVFENDEIAESHSVAKDFRVAKAIALQPSNEMLNLAYTKSLLKQWKADRANNKIISEFFLAATLEINFRVARTTAGQIHKAFLEVLELKGYQHRSLWDLVKLAFPIIKKNKFLKFKTAEDLYTDIIAEQSNKHFERFIQKDYVECSASEFVKNPKLFNYKPLNLVLYVASELAQKSHKADLLLKTYNNSCETVFKALQDLAKFRTEDGMLVKAEVWRFGECFLFDRYNKPSISRD